MPVAAKWEPPADPNLVNLARTGWLAWKRDMPTTIAFDTETTGLEYHDRAFCGTVAWRSPTEDLLRGQPIGVEGYYFEFERGSKEFTDKSKGAFLTMLEHANVIVAHNAKFDLHKVEAALGFRLRPDQVLHDTECMSHLDDEHRPKGLKELAVSVLGFDDLIDVPGKAKDKATGKMVDVIRRKPRSQVEIDKAREWAKKHNGLRSVKEVGYHLLPRGTVVPYAILDAEWTLNLAAKLWPRVNRYADLRELYDREMLLTRTAIYDMEKAGMGTRPDYVAEQIKAYRGKCLQHELGLEAIVGKPVKTGKIAPKERALYFNPSASSPDAGEFLTARGFARESYDAENLAGITHPLASALVAYRKDTKILDSYLIALQRGTGTDGIFHMSLRQHGTVSGRTSGGSERGDQ